MRSFPLNTWQPYFRPSKSPMCQTLVGAWALPLEFVASMHEVFWYTVSIVTNEAIADTIGRRRVVSGVETSRDRISAIRTFPTWQQILLWCGILWDENRNEGAPKITCFLYLWEVAICRHFLMNEMDGLGSIMFWDHGFTVTYLFHRRSYENACSSIWKIS